MENNIHSNKQLELQEDFQKGKWVPLGVCAQFINGDRGVNYPKHSDYVGEGIPFINTGHITPEGWLDLENMQYITYEKFTSLRSGKVSNGDIVYCLRGSTIGKIARANVNEGAIASSLVIIRALDGVCQDYLFHFLSTNYGKGGVSQYDNGSAQPNLSVNAISKFKIFLPPYEAQVKIADFINTFDTKISLNNKINQTLDRMAENLFKSWFVDFDPVVDNALDAGFFEQDLALPDELLRRAEARRAVREHGDFKQLPEATRQLFPAAFEECAEPSVGLGGWVPKGWVVGELQDLLVLQRGFDLPASTRTPGAYPLIAASGPNGTHNIAMAKGPGVVTGRSGVLGKVFLTLEDYWPLNTTLWVKEFKHATPCYAYELLRMLDFSAFNAGSAVPTLNRNHIHSLRYLLPSIALIQEFEAQAILMHQHVLANTKQTETLSTLRDTLLPKLISGELRLDNIEADLTKVEVA